MMSTPFIFVSAYSWESTVIPEVALVWEAVAHKSELALLDVLLDRVQEFFFGNLKPCQSDVPLSCVTDRPQA
jgi:hypothetical protein